MLRVGRTACAALGVLAWGYWWTVGRGLPPRPSTLIWAAALLLLGAALFSRWHVPRPSRATLWAAIILVIAMGLRLWALESFPYLVGSDEICYSLRAPQAWQEHAWEIFRSADSECVNANYLAEVMQAWPSAFVSPLLGIRLASALYGIVCVIVVYALARRLGGPAVAAVAVTVVACSYWHIVMSRTAYPNIVAILVVCAALLALAAAIAERNLFLAYAGGILVGMSFLVYDPARVVVPVAGLWLAHWFLFDRTAPWRRRLSVLAAVALGLAVFLSPYQDDRGLLASVTRWRQVSVNDPDSPVQRAARANWEPSATLAVYGEQVWRSAAVYIDRGAWIGPHDASPTPIIDPISLALAVIGLCICARRWRDSGAFLVLAWVGCTFVLGQVLTSTPHYRMGGMIPALAVAAGFAGATLDAKLSRLRFTKAAALVALLAVVLPMNLSYVERYMLERGSTAPSTTMGRFIHDADPDPTYYVVGPPAVGMDLTFRFLTQRHTLRYVSDLQGTLEKDLDPIGDAVFVLHADAVAATGDLIRRRYPAATPIAGPSFWPAGEPIALAVAAGSTPMPASVDNAEPDGLLARYFAGRDFDGEVVVERIEPLPLRWLTAEEAERIGSIEWTGRLTLPRPGKYAFYLIANYATGTATIGAGIDLTSAAGVEAELEAGELPIRLRCRPDRFGSCHLYWMPPGMPYQPVLPGFFHPAEPGRGRVATVATGQR